MNIHRRPRVRQARHGAIVMFVSWSIATAVGCSVGPPTVPRDRMDYGEALATSQREELLRNLVRLRYLESPLFLSVNSVVNQYSVEGNLDAGFGWMFGTGSGTSSSVGGGGSYYDRPTITYAPMAGDEFVQAYLRPIQLRSLLALVQSGYRFDFLFPLMVRAIDGHDNANHAGRRSRFADPEFTEIVRLLTELQVSGDFRVRARYDPEHPARDPRFFFEWTTPEDPARRGALDRLKNLLDLDPDAPRTEVVFGDPMPGRISIITRSALGILVDVASYIEVPEDDVAKGLVRRGMPADADQRRPMRIRSGDSPPDSAFVSVSHDGRWYWVDRQDADSKECLMALVILANISRESAGSGTPVLTIPAG